MCSPTVCCGAGCIACIDGANTRYCNDPDTNARGYPSVGACNGATGSVADYGACGGK